MEQRNAWETFYEQNERPWRGSSDIGWISFPEGSSVLELGCGNGKTSSALVAAGYSVTGVDFSDAAVYNCKEMCPGHRFICADVTELPFEDDSFDGAVAFHVLEHLDDAGMVKALDEIQRVLRNRSHLFVKVFSADDMRSMKGELVGKDTVVRGNGIRYRYFTESSLKDFFTSFEVLFTRKVQEKTRFDTIRSRIEAEFVVHK